MHVRSATEGFGFVAVRRIAWAGAAVIESPMDDSVRMVLRVRTTIEFLSLFVVPVLLEFSGPDREQAEYGFNGPYLPLRTLDESLTTNSVSRKTRSIESKVDDSIFRMSISAAFVPMSCCGALIVVNGVGYILA
jgi:hypothetical protein